MPEVLKPALGFGVKPSSMQWIWILDCSDSMRMNRRMDALNTAIKTALPEILKITKGKDGVKEFNMFMRVLKFSTGAEWVTKDNIPISDFEWIALTAVPGVTDLGEAFILLSKAMKSKNEGGLMPDRAKKPHLILITDGYPTDDWESGLKILMQEPWAQRARRMAIGLQGADHEVLKAFIGDQKDKDECLVMVSDDNYETMAENLANKIIILSDMIKTVPGEIYPDPVKIPDKDEPFENNSNIIPPPNDENSDLIPGDTKPEEDSSKKNIPPIIDETVTFQ